MKTFPGTYFVHIFSLLFILNFLAPAGISADDGDVLLPISRSSLPSEGEPLKETSSDEFPLQPTPDKTNQAPLTSEKPHVDNQFKNASTQSSEAIWDPEEVMREPAPEVQKNSERSNSLDLLNHQESFFWMAGGDDKIGMTRLGIRAEVDINLNLKINPFYYVTYLDGPRNTDLPARLYETGVKFQWTKMVNPRFRFHTSVTPTVQSDFDNDTSDSFRFIAQAMGFFIYSKETQLIFGGIYLDREDIKALPIAGLIHQFSPEFKMELVFPRPKLSWLLTEDSVDSHWLYLGGEFGGGSWAIRRNDPNRSMDIVTYSDLRIVLGMDTKGNTGKNCFYEIGYVFDRELEYESNRGNFRPDETFFFRIGSNY